jgi:hypothetical protein
MMKKADVRIGGQYYATVTKTKVVVRIDAENANGGWDATNLSTGKKVRIKTAQRLQATAKSKSAATAGTKAKTPANVKKLSCVGAALQVLTERGTAMNAKELIDAMQSKGYWASPDGKTPHATLYSAILRDLKKGEASRFVKTERGRFTARVS